MLGLVAAALLVRSIEYLLRYGPRGPLPLPPLPELLLYLFSDSYACFSDAPDPGTRSLVLHQSYKSTVLPPLYASWSESWRSHHPAWKYKFWSDEENRQLVVDHYRMLMSHPSFTFYHHHYNYFYYRFILQSNQPGSCPYMTLST